MRKYVLKFVEMVLGDTPNAMMETPEMEMVVLLFVKSRLDGIVQGDKTIFIEISAI
jgi:hypothetical protein